MQSLDRNIGRAGIFHVLAFTAFTAEKRAAILRPIELKAAPVMTTESDGPLQLGRIEFLLGKLRERDRLAFHR
jgi:hypothetical protein